MSLARVVFAQALCAFFACANLHAEMPSRHLQQTHVFVLASCVRLQHPASIETAMDSSRPLSSECLCRRSFRANICDFLWCQLHLTQLCGGCLLRSYYYDRMPYMTDHGLRGAPPGCVSTRRRARGRGPSTHLARPSSARLDSRVLYPNKNISLVPTVSPRSPVRKLLSRQWRSQPRCGQSVSCGTLPCTQVRHPPSAVATWLILAAGNVHRGGGICRSQGKGAAPATAAVQGAQCECIALLLTPFAYVRPHSQLAS